MIIHLILISVTISKAKLVKLLILVIITVKMVKLLAILKVILVIKLLQYNLLRLLIITTVAMRVKVAIKDNLLLIIKAVKVAIKVKLQAHNSQLLLYNQLHLLSLLHHSNRLLQLSLQLVITLVINLVSNQATLVLNQDRLLHQVKINTAHKAVNNLVLKLLQ